MLSNSDIQIWQDAVKGINESGKTDLTQKEWSALTVLNACLTSGNFHSEESRNSYNILKDSINLYAGNSILQKHLYDFMSLCYKYATTLQSSTTQTMPTDSEDKPTQNNAKQSIKLKNILFGADGQFKQTLLKNLKFVAICLLGAVALAAINYVLNKYANMPGYVTALVFATLTSVTLLRKNQNGNIREALAFVGATVAGIYMYFRYGEQISGGSAFVWTFLGIGLLLSLIGKNKPKLIVWLAEVIPAALCFLAFERLGGAISGFGEKDIILGNLTSVRYIEAFKIFLLFCLFQTFANNTVVAQYREHVHSLWKNVLFYGAQTIIVLLLFCVFLNPFKLSIFDNVKSQMIAFSQPVSANAEVFDAAGNKLGNATKAPISNALLSKYIPGYLATAYNFSYDSEFDTARITFEYDAGLGRISERFQPRIYYFNETDGTLEELPDQIVYADYDGGWSSVTAKTSHFSTYILLNSVEYNKVWTAEIRRPAEADLCSCGLPTNMPTSVNFDVVFVIDESGSMNQNDPNRLRVEAAKQFIDMLATDSKSNRAAIYGFENYARSILKLTALNDKEAVKASLNSIHSGGGTNIYSGLQAAVQEIEANNDNYTPVVILMTDGQDNSTLTNYTPLIDRANAKGITVFAIGLGKDVNSTLLRQICDNTGGGVYYYAESSDVLPSIFKSANAAIIDYTKDSNGDGISDYYAQLLSDGTLRLSNGSNQFKEIDWVNCAADYDGDGLLNGEELVITGKVVNGTMMVFVQMKSDPTDENSRWTDEEFSLPDENKYHKKIAETAAIYSMLAYDESRIDGTKQTLNENSCTTHLYYLENYFSSIAGWTLFDTDTKMMVYSGDRKDGCGIKYDPAILKKQLEFDEYTFIKLYNYGDSNGNNISFTLATRKINSNEILVTVVLRGTDGVEWYGNMEVDWSQGANTPVRHSSFEAANKGLQDTIISYIKKTIKCDCKKINFFITGHSRGAAVANLLAADITSGELKKRNIDVGKVFAYTFATPNNTKDKEEDMNGGDKRYKNIFNFWFRDDFVPQVPLELWGYKKYGKSFETIAEYSYGGDAGQFRPMMNAYAMLSKNQQEPKFKESAVDSVMKVFENLCPDIRSYYEEKERTIFVKNLFGEVNVIAKPMSVFYFMHHYVATAAQQPESWETISMIMEILPGMNDYNGIPTDFSPLCKFFLSQRNEIIYSHQAFTYWIALKCNKFNMDGYEDGGGDLHSK